MLSFTVRLRFDQGDVEAVGAMLRELTTASRKEPGCVSYVAHFVEAEPSTALIYEQYEDAAALEFHSNTPHFHQYAVCGFYQLMLDRQTENLVAVG